MNDAFFRREHKAKATRSVIISTLLVALFELHHLRTVLVRYTVSVQACIIVPVQRKAAAITVKAQERMIIFCG